MHDRRVWLCRRSGYEVSCADTPGITPRRQDDTRAAQAYTADCLPEVGSPAAEKDLFGPMDAACYRPAPIADLHGDVPAVCDMAQRVRTAYLAVVPLSN
jgi:hypothetical protein